MMWFVQVRFEVATIISFASMNFGSGLDKQRQTLILNIFLKQKPAAVTGERNTNVTPDTKPCRCMSP